MAFRVTISPRAFQDIDEATLYIAHQGNPLRAGPWRERLLDLIEGIGEMPYQYAFAPESDDIGIEFRQFHHHSHRVIFRITPNTIEVLRVYHSAQRAIDLRELPD